MILLKKLDRYLLKYYLLSLLVVILAIGTIIVVINMVENLRNFVDNQVPTMQIIEYYLYFGGWVIKSFFPVFVLLAALFSVSMLARRNEILAIKASGLSLYRIILPYLLVTILLAGGHFYYNEYIYPDANQKRVQIKEFEIKRRSRRRYDQATDIKRQINPNSFYTIALLNIPRGEGQDFRLYQTKNNRLAKVITSDKISFRDFNWIAQQGVIRTFDDSVESSYEQFNEMRIPEIQDKPKDLGRQLGKPEDMGLEELQDYINTMKRAGAPYKREAIDLQIKYSYPVTSIIIILIAIPFASNPRRGGIAISFAVGAGIALLYFVLFRLLQSAGYNEKIPDYIAVWGMNAFFFLFGIISLFKARK